MDAKTDETDTPPSGTPAAPHQAPTPTQERQDEDDGRPDLSIVICTFRRQDLLGACLESCLAQDLPADVSIEVVVIDNCPEVSARTAVAPFMERGPVRYISEPRTNISHARNRGVEASLAPLLAFVDDDNVLPKDWVQTILTMMADEGIACVFGDVEPAFPDTVDDGRAALVRPFFERRVPGEADGRVRALPSGHIRGARTCNVVLRKDVCFPPETAPWFDPAFGLCGGEDTDFFMRLGKRLTFGSIRTSAKASMKEAIPADRVNADYVVGRSYWGGQVYALAMARNVATDAMGKAGLFARASAQVAMLGTQRAGYVLTGRTAPLQARADLAAALGKLNGGALLRKTQPYR